jgi:hypothetical protein
LQMAHRRNQWSKTPLLSARVHRQWCCHESYTSVQDPPLHWVGIAGSVLLELCTSTK